MDNTGRAECQWHTVGAREGGWKGDSASKCCDNPPIKNVRVCEREREGEGREEWVREGGVKERESHCRPVLPQSSSVSGAQASPTDRTEPRWGNKGILSDEETTTDGEDGIKRKSILLLSFSLPTSVWSIPPVKTHTYDIYIKFLYIYIKLCLFSKKLQLEMDSFESKIYCMRNWEITHSTCLKLLHIVAVRFFFKSIFLSVWRLRQNALMHVEIWKTDNCVEVTTITTTARASAADSPIFPKGLLLKTGYFLICPLCHATVWLSHLHLSLSFQRAGGLLFQRDLCQHIAESAKGSPQGFWPPALIFLRKSRKAYVAQLRLKGEGWGKLWGGGRDRKISKGG